LSRGPESQRRWRLGASQKGRHVIARPASRQILIRARDKDQIIFNIPCAHNLAVGIDELIVQTVVGHATNQDALGVDVQRGMHPSRAQRHGHESASSSACSIR